MQFVFDASQFDPSMGLEPWIDGWHDVVIVDSKPLPAKSGEGNGFLALTIQSQQAGPNKPQIIRLNIWNKNPQAVEIANREMSAIIHVTLGANQGRLNMLDTSELHNIPFKVLVGRQADRPNLNQFLAYKDVRGNDPKGNPAGAPAPGPTGGPPASFGGPPAGMPPQAPAGWQQPGAPAPVPQQPPQQWQQPPQQAPAPQQPPAGFAPPQQPAQAFQPPQQPMQQPAQQWQPGAPAGGPPAAVPAWQQPRQ